MQQNGSDAIPTSSSVASTSNATHRGVETKPMKKKNSSGKLMKKLDDLYQMEKKIRKKLKELSDQDTVNLLAESTPEEEEANERLTLVEEKLTAKLLKIRAYFDKHCGDDEADASIGRRAVEEPLIINSSGCEALNQELTKLVNAKPDKIPRSRFRTAVISHFTYPTVEQIIALIEKLREQNPKLPTSDEETRMLWFFKAYGNDLGVRAEGILRDILVDMKRRRYNDFVDGQIDRAKEINGDSSGNVDIGISIDDYTLPNVEASRDRVGKSLDEFLVFEAAAIATDDAEKSQNNGISTEQNAGEEDGAEENAGEEDGAEESDDEGSISLGDSDGEPMPEESEANSDDLPMMGSVDSNKNGEKNADDVDASASDGEHSDDEDEDESDGEDDAEEDGVKTVNGSESKKHEYNGDSDEDVITIEDDD